MEARMNYAKAAPGAMRAMSGLETYLADCGLEDAGRLHFGIYPGGGRILLINMELSTKRVEAPSRRTDRHDSDSKRCV